MGELDRQPEPDTTSPLDRLRRRQPPLVDAEVADRGRQARQRRAEKRRGKKATRLKPEALSLP